MHPEKIFMPVFSDGVYEKILDKILNLSYC